MKEIYYLNKNEVPTIPVPHDCVIKDVRLDENSIVFVFEDDISYHDGIKSIRPDAKSLVVTCHFLCDKSDITMFVRGKANRLLHKPGTYKEIENRKLEMVLQELIKQNLTYLYHNVGYCSMIVQLWSARSVILDLTIDYAEFEWLE